MTAPTIRHIETRQWSVRWCATCDRRFARCELELAAADPPEGHDATIVSGGHACWLSCTCGTAGPRRAGDAESAWVMALADRAAHLAGEHLDNPLQLDDVAPAVEELVPA